MEWIRIFAGRDDMNGRLTPDQPTLLRIGGRRICLVWRHDELFAVEDSCPHNGESLSKGTLNYLGEVICPWHGYRYDLRTGREGAERCRDLITYPVESRSDGIYVGL
jgi:nitrite reductase/ring-hydroxylating ferredoxin subunit